jgi:DNA polymerase III alpha subunit
MHIDQYGQKHQSTDELCSLLYFNPDVNLHELQVDDPYEFNHSIKELYYEINPLNKYKRLDIPIEEFDSNNQIDWFMPIEYKELDIVKWVLEQCKEDYELQRVGEELLLYQDRNLLDLLRFLKYFVDTMRKHKVVWGVGRGSSTASYVLFLLQVHRINSIYYGLEITEFLK